MNYTLGVSLITFIIYSFFYFMHIRYDEGRIRSYEIKLYDVILLFISGLAIHMYFAHSYYGFKTDVDCFRSWSSMIYNDGISNFYKSKSFTDYPPGYMYILYVIGAIQNATRESVMLIKMPAQIFDILFGLTVYFICQNRFSRKNGLILSFIAMLCPTLVLNSSIWGQVDIVYTFLLLIFIMALIKNKLYFSYFVFAVCILIKPQALIFTPLLLFKLVSDVIMTFECKKIFKHIFVGLLAICLLFLLCVPFGLKEVFMQYASTIKSYPYFSVNAFNLWAALGKNWDNINDVGSMLGYVYIIAIVVFCTILYFKGNKNLFFLGGVLSFLTYMLSVKMHDRYAFPAVAMFFMAYLYKTKKQNFFLFMYMTISQFINAAFILFVYEKDPSKYFKSTPVYVFSIINLILLVYMIYIAITYNNTENVENTTDEYEKFSFEISKHISKLSKKDYIIMISIALIYSIISFVRLGETVSPKSYYDLAEAPIEIEMGSPTKVDKIILYLSCNDLNEDRTMIVDFKKSDGTIEEKVLNDFAVFEWNFIDENIEDVTKITFSTDYNRLMIMEMGVISNGEVMQITSDNAVFDEQYLIPPRRTSQNGTYFDEIYHARTAYEFIHGFTPYEWTHPPLGKAIMSIGVKIFGMNPFGWRFSGNIFGILMIFIFYITAKKIFGNTFICATSTILFTFDFMHFVQTRIATIDVYGTFFIMLMYLFFYKFYSTSFYDKKLKYTFVPLILTGIAFGLGAASKWTAIYACGGIAVLFFMKMYRRYYEYNLCDVEDRKQLRFYSKFIITGILCVCVFILIPICIYCASYYQYLHTEYANGFKTILENQVDMFTYHSKTVVNSTHPYSSRWYTWPIMIRPIWYYSGTISQNVKEGISAFGNPAVWWVGVFAIFYNGYLAIVKKNRTAIFLIVGYLSCLLPWVLVERTTYIYHYFPCVSFIVLMIANCMDIICKKYNKCGKIICIVYVLISLILFAMFYPVLTGLGVNTRYVDIALRWLSSWVLV